MIRKCSIDINIFKANVCVCFNRIILFLFNTRKRFFFRLSADLWGQPEMKNFSVTNLTNASFIQNSYEVRSELGVFEIALGVFNDLHNVEFLFQFLHLYLDVNNTRCTTQYVYFIYIYRERMIPDKILSHSTSTKARMYQPEGRGQRAELLECWFVVYSLWY